MTAKEKYLKSHLDLVERVLLCRSSVAASSGHPVLQGTIREDFIREFVSGHIGEDMSVSPGEVFDSERVIRGRSNQIDVIIYSKNFPKIQMSESTFGFMIESVHATIEVKSTLNYDDLQATYKTAHAILNLRNEFAKARNWRTWCYLVAYDSQVKIPTIANWLCKVAQQEACKSTSNALAGAFILGQGFVVSPSVAHSMAYKPGLQLPVARDREWVYVEQESGNLYALFFALNFLRYGIDIRHYFEGVLPAYKIAAAHTKRKSSKKTISPVRRTKK